MRPPELFPEYAKVATREPQNLAPLHCPGKYYHAVQITVKKAFTYGKFLGVWVTVHNTVMKEKTINLVFLKTVEKGSLKEDQEFGIKFIRHAVVDGQARKEVAVAFYSLNLGKLLSPQFGILQIIDSRS